ncbi:hypothetical protein [Thermogemmatispora carboxidivorans]|uniref:hypothetical protein n=1 Tax=Thermogemmatispora carboxidivorans TaxID=1382306 RepID=UPI00069B8605|nr:hypothetical protein [Thermogemmatispora carboxidivorans]
MLGGMLKRSGAVLLSCALMALVTLLISRAGEGTAHLTSTVAAASKAPALTCGAWRRVPDAAEGALVGVTAFAPDNAWIVGSQGSVPLIQHWNGKAWSIVPSPAPSEPALLKSISGSAPDDIWAVGSTTNTPNHTLVEHWDGKSWSIVSDAVGTGQLNGVVALAHNDVWAVGTSNSQALIEHWDGKSWSVALQANLAGQGDSLLAIAASSAHDIWAVGTSLKVNYNFQGYGVNLNMSSMGSGVIVHWDGNSWKAVSGQGPSTQMAMLSGVTALAPDNVWVVGSTFQGSLLNGMQAKTLVEHWNGSQWSVVPSSDAPNAFASYLTGVAAVSPGNVWAVGGAFSGSHFSALLENWDGAHWNLIQAPNAADGRQHMLLGAAAVPNTKQVWVVGLHGTVLTNCG